MDNSAVSCNILPGAIRSLELRLPQGWTLVRRAEGHTDGILELVAPDGRAVQCEVVARRRLEPRDVEQLVRRMGEAQEQPRPGKVLMVTPFVTPRTQELLTQADLWFLDLTGNCRIVSDSPGLFISTTGHGENPWPEERRLHSLKGAVAGRIVRALCEGLPPLGVRELAARTGADVGYVSRLLEFLDREALIVRKPRGAITEVRWKALIHRWAADYSPFLKGRAFTYLEPRGLQALVNKLKDLSSRYAVTGSMAASWMAPVAPPRLMACYVDDPELIARDLHLRPAEAGINVMLLLPFDLVVYHRTWSHQEVVAASPCQVAADLLRSPGRGPEEAVALLDSMEEEEHVWRA